MPSETIPEHADPALRRLATWADELRRSAHTATREGQGKMPTTGDLVRVRVYTERAEDLAHALQRIAALEEALEPFGAAYSEHMWHVLVTYGFGELTPSRTNFTIPREAFARSARVLSPEEGR